MAKCTNCKREKKKKELIYEDKSFKVCAHCYGKSPKKIIQELAEHLVEEHDLSIEEAVDLAREQIQHAAEMEE